MSAVEKKLIMSELEIDKHSPEPLHLQLYNALKETIIKHRLEPGFAVPSERQLSTQFKINRNTVHRAYETLHNEGFLTSRPGSRGLYISDDAKDKYQPSFPCIGILLTCSFSDFVSKGNRLGMNYLSGVVDRANELNHSTMIVNLPPVGTSRADIQEWRNNLFSRLNGVIYFGDRCLDDDYAFESMVTYTPLPQVFVSGFSPHKNVSSVYADVRSGGMAAAELLRENGHRKVGIVIPNINYEKKWGFLNASLNRKEEMIECFRHCGLQIRPEWLVHDCDDRNSINLALDRVMSRDDVPTAFWCHNDFTALHVLDYFNDRGIKVPDEISVVGFDDTEEAAKSHPPLTSIRAGTYTIGKNAVDMVIDLFENGRPGESRKLAVPTSLSCRGSISRVVCDLTGVN